MLQRRMFLFWTTILALTVCCALCFEQRACADDVDVSLISSRTSVAPGETFVLGAYFKIKEPWHIYWKDPGAAGLPTRVSFKLPQGYTLVGDLMWPPHLTFDQAGGLIGYGYTREVLLWQEVRAPDAIDFGERKTISAQVRWVACGSVCVPGKKDLEIEIAFGASHPSADNQLIADWVNRTLNERSNAH